MRIPIFGLAFLAGISPVLGQTLGVGVGIGSGTATSSAGNATSNASGGAATSNAQGGGVTFNQGSVPANTRNDQTLDQTLTTRGGTVSRQTGSLRNAPAVFAPGLAAAGLETCLGSVSGGGSFMGGGFSFGTTVPDPGCNTRLTARTLWSMGLKRAAVARLCLDSDVVRSMPEVCAEYLPQPGPTVGTIVPAPRAEARLEPSAPNGAVEVIERASGRTRLCARFDAARGRCLAWAR